VNEREMHTREEMGEGGLWAGECAVELCRFVVGDVLLTRMCSGGGRPKQNCSQSHNVNNPPSPQQRHTTAQSLRFFWPKTTQPYGLGTVHCSSVVRQTKLGGFSSRLRATNLPSLRSGSGTFFPETQPFLHFLQVQARLGHCFSAKAHLGAI
jgi:hypothetical protein